MCGPASLKIVLAYYGIQATEKTIAKCMGTIKKLGSNDKGIVRAVKHFGLHAEVKNRSSLHDIEKWLQKGIPVIVNWFTRGRPDYSDSNIADGHYSVVEGIDDRFIYLQDPEIGKIRKLKKDDFLKVWFDFTGKYINPNELLIRQGIVIYHKKV